MAIRSRRRGGALRSGPPAPPDVPSSAEAALLPAGELEPEATYRLLRFANLVLPAQVAEAADFRQCRIRDTDLSDSVLDRSALTDCVIDHSNLANVRAGRGSLARVHIARSRLTGWTWLDGLVRDTTFEECRLDLSGWRFSDFDAVLFRGCNLAKADFTSANLTGARFVDCDLSGAVFDRARMTGTRVENCTLAGIGGVTSWAGAIVRAQDVIAWSIAFAGGLGVRVEDEDEDG
ncbi:MAG: pentapeptide repeat-containing protein [Dactylosporangium sp.]|nr:pentapeptide repeat-containing protein [Dactylosporangium sp.]NNJ62967.1 pentapeptide repeat-containing protein [Dactylosporangium sp.]